MKSRPHNHIALIIQKIQSGFINPANPIGITDQSKPLSDLSKCISLFRYKQKSMLLPYARLFAITTDHYKSPED